MPAPSLHEFTRNSIQPSPVDLRDIPYRSPFTPEQIDNEIDLRDDVLSVPDQLHIGSCGGNMFTNQIEHIDNQNGVRREYSRLYSYVMTKHIEGRLQDSGVFIRDLYKVGRKYGTPTEQQYPYDTSKSKVLPPDDIHPLAFENRVDRYEAVVRSRVNDGSRSEKIHRVKSCLQEGLPVGFGVTVTDSLRHFSGPLLEHDYETVREAGDSIGGHAMLIVGSSKSLGGFIVLNSWGTDWGDAGFGLLPWHIVDEPFFEAWIVRSFRGWEIPETPGWKFEFINRFRLNARYVPTAEERGTVGNLWIGGVIDGELYMRLPRYRGGGVMLPDELDGSKYNYNSIADNWAPVASIPNLEPTFRNVPLDDDVFCRIVQWLDMSSMAGGEIYAAMTPGDDLLGGKVYKICTIPVHL
jgi:hypothetical protein